MLGDLGEELADDAVHQRALGARIDRRQPLVPPSIAIIASGIGSGNIATLFTGRWT